MNNNNRKIGQSATLNGVPVLWSGKNYGWQSPSSFNTLKEKGKFKVGTQAIDRIASAVKRRIGADNINRMTRGADLATKPLQVLTGLLEQTPTAVGAVARAQSGLGQLQNQAVGAVSDRTNVDPRLIQGAVTAGEVALGSTAGLRRGARRITPPTRQSTGQGLPNRIRGRLGQRRGDVGAIGDIHFDPDAARASARREGTSFEVRTDGLYQEVRRGIVDNSPEAQRRRRSIYDQQFPRDSSTDTSADLRQPPGSPRPPTPQEQQRVREALGRRDTSASGYVQDISQDAYRQAQGAIKNPLTVPDINDRTQTVAQGFISDLRLQPGESLPGYQVSKPYVARGDSGSAYSSISKPIKDFVIREFQQTDPRSGAVIGKGGKDKGKLLQAGKKVPTDRYIRDRYNELIREINRRNGSQSPYGQKPDTPRQPSGVVQRQIPLKDGGSMTRPGSRVNTQKGDRRRETPAERQRRIKRGEERRRDARGTKERVEELRQGQRGSNFQEGNKADSDRINRRLQSRRAEQDLPDLDSDVGQASQNAPQRGRKDWTPPRRFKNESAEKYATRILEARVGKNELLGLTFKEKQQLLRQLGIKYNPDLPRGSQFTTGGELQGTRIKGRGTGRGRGRSAQQQRDADSLKDGTSKPRTPQQEAQMRRIRSRRQRNR